VGNWYSPCVTTYRIAVACHEGMLNGIDGESSFVLFYWLNSSLLRLMGAFGSLMIESW
jgi:hypothetical protein